MVRLAPRQPLSRGVAQAAVKWGNALGEEKVRPQL